VLFENEGRPEATASKRWLQRRLGVLGPQDLEAVGWVVRVQLAL